MLKAFVFLFVCLVTVTTLASAQTEYNSDVSGGYSYASVDTNGLTHRLNANGWQASGSAEFVPHLAIEAEAAGHYYTFALPGTGIPNINVWDFFGGGGPRFNFGPAFLHAILGADTLGTSGQTQGGFAALYGGGVQVPIHGHWAMRVGADYAMSYHNVFDGPRVVQHNFLVNVGIAYRFHSGHRQSVSSKPEDTNVPRSPLPEGPVTVTLVQIGVKGYPNVYGIFVENIVAGSPAERAGIHRGDTVARINGHFVRTPHDADLALSSSPHRAEIGILPPGAIGDRVVILTVELQ
jgi:hypothetical protein